MATPVTRIEAQRRADRIRAFEAELRDLAQEAGVTLTPEQLASIAAHHAALLAQYSAQFDVAVSAGERRLSRGMQAAGLAGGVALAASLVLFVLNIWGGLSTATQVATVVATPLLLVMVAELSSRWRRMDAMTGLCATLAFAAFALDVQVLGGLFALTPTPEALLADGVFAVALAYAYDTRLLLAVGATCLGAWVGAIAVRATGAWWLAFPERPESFLLAAWGVWGWSMLPHRTRDGFPPVLRALAVAATAVVVLVLGSDGDLSWLPADPDAIEVTYQVVGFALSASVLWIAIRRDWPEVLVVGSGWFALTLVIKYVGWWWDWMPMYLFFFIVGVTALALLLFIRRLRAYAQRVA